MQKVKELGQGNEILIVLKEASATGISRNTLQKLGSSKDILAQAEAKTGAAQRTKPGFARVNSRSRQAIKGILQANSMAEFRAPDLGNIITVKLPEEGAEGLIAALLNSPNVDYIEANRSIPITFDSPTFSLANPLKDFSTAKRTNYVILGDPQGSNNADQKHTFHNVLDAWDDTRGAGAKVGVFDSGLAYDRGGSNTYHPDGQLINSGKGILKKGFVDDYNDFENCTASQQSNGNCLGWDDAYNDLIRIQGHGTQMAGLVGANDNNQGNVGIMPDGLTVSMKVAQNCKNSTDCDDGSGVQSEYLVRSDDFVAAVQWASSNNVDVLSISISGTIFAFTPSMANAMYDAYHQDDILILSSTRNDNANKVYPQKFSYVMGVHGLELNGDGDGFYEYADIAALAGGGTLEAYCGNAQTGFCKPNGSRYLIPPDGGTSAATAIAAGIAGLVRAYNPSLSAPQVRQRLINTSVPAGSNPTPTKLDAWRAVTGDEPLTVYVNGTNIIENEAIYIWEAMPSGGNTSYSYQWQYREYTYHPWQTVGSSKSYSQYVETNGQNFYLRVTVTSGNEQDSVAEYIYVSDSSGCGTIDNPCQ